MRRKLIVALGFTALMGAVAGCGDEDPTEVGSVLIGEGVRTFEVVLDASEFLQSDTTYDQIGNLLQSPFRLLASEFEGELDAHTLFRVNVPATVSYQDTGGVTVTDSTPVYLGGRLTLVMDSVASTPRPVSIEVRPVTESWDPGSVTWTLRSDTAGGPEVWTEPGGTTGAAAGSRQWTTGDTVVVPIDSATVALWQDTLAARRGGLIRSATAGSRVIVRALSLEFDVDPAEPTDTAVVAGSLTASRAVASAEPGVPGDTVLRVGGLPVWRSLLRFQPLSEVSIDCSAAVNAPCTVPLSAVDINLATLILTPAAAGAFRVERPIWLESRAVLEADGIPLVRSPLTGPLGRMEDSVATDLFMAPPPAGAIVEVPVTSYVNRLVSPPDDEEPWPWLALTALGERTTFGHASFLSMTSVSPPGLRLVVTAPEPALQQ